MIETTPDYREAILTIGCVDTAAARFEIAHILNGLNKAWAHIPATSPAITWI